jgi:hypothetical protein
MLRWDEVARHCELRFEYQLMCAFVRDIMLGFLERWADAQLPDNNDGVEEGLRLWDICIPRFHDNIGMHSVRSVNHVCWGRTRLCFTRSV